MMMTEVDPMEVTLSVIISLTSPTTTMMTSASTTVMDGLMNSVRCPVKEHLPPASIPTQAAHPVRSSPTIPNVPMFLQDARDVMMFAPVEMATKTNWTTLPIVLGTNHHALERTQDHHHLKCVTTSATRMEVAL